MLVMDGDGQAVFGDAGLTVSLSLFGLPHRHGLARHAQPASLSMDELPLHIHAIV